MTPTYQSGFYAPGRGVPKHESLWDGCVGSWAPCLGPSGLTLRDWSGFGRHGTLTNMDPATDWVPQTGQYALDIDGSNDRVVYSALAVTMPYSFCIWARARSFAGNVGAAIGGVGYVPFGTPYALYTNGTTVYTAGTTFIRQLAFTSSLNVWYHYAWVITSTASSLYVNGKLIGSDSSAGNQTFQNIGAQGDGAFPWNGQLDDFRVYNYALSQPRLRQLASRRAVAYELAPRKSYFLPPTPSSHIQYFSGSAARNGSIITGASPLGNVSKIQKTGSTILIPEGRFDDPKYYRS